MMIPTYSNTDCSFEVRIDALRGPEWDEVLSKFDDASIYQTAAYGNVRWGANNLMNLVLLKDGRELAAAQLRLFAVRPFRSGIAYVGCGPAWQPSGEEPDIAILRRMLRLLREELVLRRGYHLRIVPNLFQEAHAEAKTVFTEEGFHWQERNTRTILLDLTPSLDELRAGLRATWRHTLDKAERRGLELCCGNSLEMLKEALSVYDEMHARKGFAEFADVHGFGGAQALLPVKYRLRVILCRERGETIAAIAWAVLGRTGLVLMAGTRARALEYKISNLLWWKMLEWLKENGFSQCDLGGVNAQRNSGGYIFKSGMAKTYGTETVMLGNFDSYQWNLGHFAFVAAKSQRDFRVKAALLWERFRSQAALLRMTSGTKEKQIQNQRNGF